MGKKKSYFLKETCAWRECFENELKFYMVRNISNYPKSLGPCVGHGKHLIYIWVNLIFAKHDLSMSCLKIWVWGCLADSPSRTCGTWFLFEPHIDSRITLKNKK